MAFVNSEFGGTPSVTPSTFAERLAYARWVRVVPETDQDFAARLGLSKAWVTKWKDRPDAPPGRREATKLAAALEVSEGWLMNGEGAPPSPELWPGFLTKYRAGPPRVALESDETEAHEYVARKQKAAPHKAAKKKGRRAG